MENAMDALKIAAGVLMFVLALTISISCFSQANEAVTTIANMRDRDVQITYDNIQQSNKLTRTVGIETIIKSGKLQPENITNYTKIIFKDRLEVLPSFKGEKLEYEEIKQNYPEIINLANKYYDLVFVDLDQELGETITEQILQNSNLVIANLSQRLLSINNFLKLREEIPMFNSKKTLVLINRYDKFSKYTIKNITRYMGEKNKILTTPYNTLFFEACEEAKVPDLFLRLRRGVDEEDRNYIFIQEVKRASDAIIYRLQDLAMKM